MPISFSKIPNGAPKIWKAFNHHSHEVSMKYECIMFEKTGNIGI